MVLSRWWLIAAALLALALSSFAALFLGKVILPEALPPPQSSKLLAADGQLIATLHSEENRTLVPLSEVAVPLREAVVATEDRSFYKHAGVSVRGIFRALIANVRQGSVVQGGSTITQQYVRNSYTEVGRERTVFRKVREVVMAVKLEQRYSKSKILEFYLNTVYFGRGAYGAEAAARIYFKKSAKDLTSSEAAFLAGVIRAPERHQPDADPDAADKVRKLVLDDMVAGGYLSDEEADRAKEDPPQFALGKADGETAERAAYFVEYVRRQLRTEFELTDGEILTGGLEVHTTLDLRMQEAAEAAISATLDRSEDPEAAIVAMDPEGRIKAMVGGRDVGSIERARQFNFAYQKGGPRGGRQAGSAFKPFTLAAFLQGGYSAESRFAAPSSITIESPQCHDERGRPWEVSNFGGQEFGEVSVVDATVQSINTVYAQMVDVVTARKVRDSAAKAGGWDLSAVCSLALGTHEVTALEMARSFATFAARGSSPEPLSVTKIIAPGGRLVAEREPSSEQVMETRVADQVNKILQEVIRRGTGRGASIGRPAAGKTGTTQNHVDAWFVGHTPDLVAAVWMGYPPNEEGAVPEMQSVRGRAVTGGFLPASIWKAFMTRALEGSKPLSFPNASFGGEVLSPSPSPEPCPSGIEPSIDPGASPGTPPVCPTPSPSPEPSPPLTPAEPPKPTGSSPPPSPTSPTSPSAPPSSPPPDE